LLREILLVIIGGVMMRLLRAGLHFYIVGLIILTLGIALTILSLLGTSLYDSLLVGLNRTFGFTVGTWEIVVGVSMFIVNSIAEQICPEYFALITSIITGIGIDTLLFLLNDLVLPTTLLSKFIFYGFGLFFTSLGTTLYLQSSLAPNPLDGTMLVVS